MLGLSGARTMAKCVSGTAPDYGDIDAIRFTQTGCGGSLHSRRANTFDCSMFYAVFWQITPQDFEAQYTQYNLENAIGTYNLQMPFRDVISVLKRDKFFALSPPDVSVTDTTKSVLEVKRCAVITRIRLFNSATDEEPVSKRLFDDLRRLIDLAPKKLVSAKPLDFKETLLFNP